ncbi:hypothetical protein K438DRAFT_1765607 [Mycena galopus ATCC 62051]|nr:hypothetical protein K438DRAFT_1765607 [Mycena galopus ATCC 62051]
MSELIPRLPVELERHIFEIAAHSNLPHIPTLLLVAHRVKLWLEPILYSVVVFSHPISGYGCFEITPFASVLQSQAISQHVKNLLCTNINVPPEPILASCSAVQNLALHDSSRVLPALLSGMPLRRLYTTLKSLFHPTDIDFTHSLFSHITHLREMDYITPNSWKKWKGLALIPNLTHLALAANSSLHVPLFEGVLAACPALRVLVCLYNYSSNLLGGFKSLAQDTRFVCIRVPVFIEDWQTGAWGGEDFWVQAERFIAQRDSGEVDRGIFVLPRA